MNLPEARLISLRTVLSMLFKRKIQILVVFGAALLTVGVGSLMKRPVYEATATIMVKLGRDNVLSAQRVNENQPPIYIEQQEIINSEIKILQGRSLVEKVVQEIGPETLYRELRQGGATGRRRGWRGCAAPSKGCCPTRAPSRLRTARSAPRSTPRWRLFSTT